MLYSTLCKDVWDLLRRICTDWNEKYFHSPFEPLKNCRKTVFIFCCWRWLTGKTSQVSVVNKDFWIHMTVSSTCDRNRGRKCFLDLLSNSVQVPFNECTLSNTVENGLHFCKDKLQSVSRFYAVSYGKKFGFVLSEETLKLFCCCILLHLRWVVFHINSVYLFHNYWTSDNWTF